MSKTRLDILLAERGLAESRAQAQRLVMAGQVRVDGQVALKPDSRVSPDSDISVDWGPPFVSRGGEKLQAALERFGIHVGLALAASARASVVTRMDTEALVQASPVVVRGEVESVAVARDEQGGIRAWVTLRVEESLRGADGRSRVALRLGPGGAWGDQVTRVFGVPEFERGERVVVFATPIRSGPLTVAGLFQGKYRIEADAAGGEVVVQDAGTGAEVAGEPGGARARRPPRSSSGCEASPRAARWRAIPTPRRSKRRPKPTRSP